jgi:hypothetical protein
VAAPGAAAERAVPTQDGKQVVELHHGLYSCEAAASAVP